MFIISKLECLGYAMDDHEPYILLLSHYYSLAYWSQLLQVCSFQNTPSVYIFIPLFPNPSDSYIFYSICMKSLSFTNLSSVPKKASVFKLDHLVNKILTRGIQNTILYFITREITYGNLTYIYFHIFDLAYLL